MKQGVIRIIAGKWRGKRITVADGKDLRPTPDRVRETVFNWLAPKIVGSRCLDAFAGTGALGFEALSRGALHVTLVEQSPAILAIIKKTLQTFQVDNVHCYQASVPDGLKKPDAPFDIVFLDPPYKSELLLPTCHFLEANGFLSKEALIYLEADRVIRDNELPENWELIKSKKAGQVFYHLATRV